MKLNRTSHTNREEDQKIAQRDTRSRREILAGSNWKKLHMLPAAQTIPVKNLRQADRFFDYCRNRGFADIRVDHVFEFDTSSSPTSLRRLRDTLRSLYGQQHPIFHVVDRARQIRCRAHRLKQGSTGQRVEAGKKLHFSLPDHELPPAWRMILDELEAGRRVKGRKVSASTARNMRSYARQLLWSARKADLPDEISMATLSAYDQDLSQRGLRATSCAMQFGFLGALIRFVQPDNYIEGAIRELVSAYKQSAAGSNRLKDFRYANLASIDVLFDQAYILLHTGLTEWHKTKRTSLLVDAAAIAFLSLIPMRNADTVLRWGKHISIDTSANDDWVYRIDTSISKTCVDFGGKLHPILNPFLEALLLQGQHPAFLQQRLAIAIANQEPVFPLSNDKARSSRNLSRRWRVRLGTGSHIARTRVHTVLGALGPKGVNYALALCAQRSYSTRLHYQDISLDRALMLESQKKLAATLPKELVSQRLEGLHA